MYSYGYCYAGETGFSGYRPEGVAKTECEAKAWIKSKLAGKNVTYTDTGCKVRADGDRTGYIYFKIETGEKWVAIDSENLGVKGRKAVIASGTLSEVKTKVRKFLDNEDFQLGELNKVEFVRTGDNIEVFAGYDGRFVTTADINLVRVS
jgi:hypothetical protein